jgi:hypothetical protein
MVTANSDGKEELRRRITSRHLTGTLADGIVDVRWIGNWVNFKAGLDAVFPPGIDSHCYSP